jgi:hypothetical protein
VAAAAEQQSQSALISFFPDYTGEQVEAAGSGINEARSAFA